MKHFVAYHNADERGAFGYVVAKEQIQFFSRRARAYLEKSLGQLVWAVSGESNNHKKIYKLCAAYSPKWIDEEGDVFLIKGPVVYEFKQQIVLNNFNWFWELFDEQQHFRLGFNEIKNPKAINGLKRLVASPTEELRKETVRRQKYIEGAKKRVTADVYERNPMARVDCLEHYGYRCYVCGFDFEQQYGEIGSGYIHVHHLKPLAEIGKHYKVDPIKDLRPVCPNCHAMLHVNTELLTIEQLRRRVKKKYGKTL